MEIKAESKHGIVNRAVNTIFSYQGWPSICRDEKGVLYAVASGMRVLHVCPFGKTVMYISRNNGETWTPPIIINDDFMDDRDAGILYLGGGRMLVTWFYHSTYSYQNSYAHGMKTVSSMSEVNAVLGMLSSFSYTPEPFTHGGSFIRISEDYGVTWSDAVKIPVSAPHGPNLLRDGSLVYVGKEMYVTEKDNNTYGDIKAFKSTDGGFTWNELSTIPTPDGTFKYNFHEPHVIELPDGRLLCAIRAQGDNIMHGFSIYTTVSTDNGRSWSVPACIGVNGSPPHLMLHSSGALICSYGRRAAPFSERALVSYDFGATWQDDYIIDSRPHDGDLGYPASVELSDGSIMTVYYQKYENDSKCSIQYSKWKLQ